MLSNLKSVAAAVAQEGLFERGSGRWVGRAIVLSVAIFSAWALASQVLPLPVSLVLTAFLATASALLGALAVTLSYLDARRINEHATATLRKESDRAKKHIALHDVATAIFHRWYFDLRLDEETRRSQRYGQPVSVIALHVRPTPELSAGAAAESLNMEYAQLAARALRAVDIPASLGEFEYAACLPNTDQRGAKATARRLATLLGKLECEIGIACYPNDCQDAGRLLDHAIEAMAPRQAFARTPPDAQPAPPQITLFTTSVKWGELAAVQAKAEPLARCEVAFLTPSGRTKRGASLAAKTADGDGLVSWSWRINRKMRPGSGEVTVSSQGQETSVTMLVLPAEQDKTSDRRLLRLAS